MNIYHWRKIFITLPGGFNERCGGKNECPVLTIAPSFFTLYLGQVRLFLRAGDIPLLELKLAVSINFSIYCSHSPLRM